MNQRINKKLLKRLKKQQVGKTTKSLPTYGYIHIGKKKFNVRYADQIEGYVSSETNKKPVMPRRNTQRGVRMLACILRNTGIDSLIDIGDAMIRKY